jgi:hypothetical protein
LKANTCSSTRLPRPAKSAQPSSVFPLISNRAPVRSWSRSKGSTIYVQLRIKISNYSLYKDSIIHSFHVSRISKSNYIPPW